MVGARRPQTRAVVRRPGQVLYATDGRDVLQNSPDGWEVEQPWLWFDGPGGDGGGGGGGGPWGNPPPGAADRPGRLLPAMARCRSLIADQLAGVPWMVHRGMERLPTPDWITDPQGLRADARVQSSVLNVRMSAQDFWSSFLTSAIELGEGIVYTPVRDSAGQPVPPVFVLNPADVTVEYGSYRVGEEELSADELIVVRNQVPAGKVRGVGVWKQFARQIGFGESIRDYASGMLGRGIPAGYLKVTAPDLSQPEADELKRRWWDVHGGRQRRIAVLNATTEFHPLQLDPQALQLAELMRLSAWEVCLIYGIPPYKLGISMGYNNTYANIESAAIDYVQDALLPWARRVESAFDALFPRGTDLKLNLDALRRADTKTRYESHQIGLAAGFLTVDEVRRLEDLPPLTEDQRAELAVWGIGASGTGRRRLVTPLIEEGTGDG